MTASNRWRALAARWTAEFFVVVLGVTMALWADAMVAERHDRSVEAARLRALRDNVEESLEGVRADREEAREAIEALRRLVVIGEESQSDADLEWALSVGLLYAPHYSPELNVYQDLKSSGELALLTDADLRRSLAGMDAELARLNLAQEDLVVTQQLNVDPYVIEHVDLRSLLHEYVGLEERARPWRAGLGFLSDPRFENLVVFKLDLVVGMERQFGEIEADLVAVLQSIEAQ